MDERYLSYEEQIDLVKRSLTGDERATVALINLCEPIAGRILQSYDLSRADQEDMMQEAMYAVLYALPRYRPDKGTKFTTYCTFWMKKRMHTFAKSNFIKCPSGIASELKVYLNFIEEFKKTQGREPNHAEIMEALGLSEQDLYKLVNNPSSHLILEKVSNILPVDEEDVADGTVTRVLLEDALEHIKDKKEDEKKAVILHYGLYSYREHTYKEIGQILGCSKEWARRLTMNGIQEMKAYFEKIGFRINS